MRWAALPLLFGDTDFPPKERWDRPVFDLHSLGKQFFFQSRNDPAELLKKGRAMIALFGVALGLVIFSWSKNIFGWGGGMISLITFLLFPLSLAYGGCVLSDLAVSLFFTASLWAFWHSLHKISPFSILASSVSIAGICLSKFSAVLIVPVFVVLIIVRFCRGRPLAVHFRKDYVVSSRSRMAEHLLAAVAVQVLIVYVLIWGGYGFRYRALRTSAGVEEEINQGLWNYHTRKQGPVGTIIEILRDNRVFPEAFLYGGAVVWYHRHTTPETPRVTFLDGEYSLEGIPSFAPLCAFYKTPIGTMVIYSLAGLQLLATGVRGRKGVGLERSNDDTFYELTPLAVFLPIYAAGCIASPQCNVAHYIFPLFPSTFVLAGAAGRWFSGKHRVAQISVCLGLLLLAFESFSIRPSYLAFFNNFVGGPRNGYKHLLDQDDGRALIELNKWLEGDITPNQPVFVSYFGQSSPSYYHIKGYRLPTLLSLDPPDPSPVSLTGGIYCISVANLDCVSMPVIGKWAVPYENAYQQFLADSRRPREKITPMSLDQKQAKVHEKALFETLQFCRLCAFLRHREPDTQIAYSILIYRLTDEDIHQALFGPPAELLPRVEVKGYQSPSVK